jgi:hypothetical protein
MYLSWFYIDIFSSLILADFTLNTLKVLITMLFEKHLHKLDAYGCLALENMYNSLLYSSLNVLKLQTHPQMPLVLVVLVLEYVFK